MVKKFTKRERVLLVVLLLILIGTAYYFLMALPTMNRITAANNKVGAIQDEMIIETGRFGQMKLMQEKIDENKKRGVGHAKIVDYDNLENVMKEMDTILSAATEYNLSFAPVENVGSMVYRTIATEFNCANYKAAQNIVNQIYNNPYKCIIDKLSVISASKDGTNIVTNPVKVSVNIIFVEQK